MFTFVSSAELGGGWGGGDGRRWESRQQNRIQSQRRGRHGAREWERRRMNEEKYKSHTKWTWKSYINFHFIFHAFDFIIRTTCGFTESRDTCWIHGRLVMSCSLSFCPRLRNRCSIFLGGGQNVQNNKWCQFSSCSVWSVCTPTLQSEFALKTTQQIVWWRSSLPTQQAAFLISVSLYNK